jgi:dephospho-CoA kinase
MQLIGFSGYGGAGKDSAAKPLIDEGWERISFADPMREMALAINPIVGVEPISATGARVIRYADAIEEVGYNDAKFKYPEFRAFLQKLGTEGGRGVLGENIWVNTAADRMEEDGRYVITDVRIDRPGVGPAGDHDSEKIPSLIHSRGDYALLNDGSLEDLWRAVYRYVARRRVQPSHLPEVLPVVR